MNFFSYNALLICCFCKIWFWFDPKPLVSQADALPLRYRCQLLVKTTTVDSRYLELGYLEFCDTRSVYMNQKYILIAFFNHTFAVGTFYKSKLPEVQIIFHFG